VHHLSSRPVPYIQPPQNPAPWTYPPYPPYKVTC
jgi:hypothetical protein